MSILGTSTRRQRWTATQLETEAVKLINKLTQAGNKLELAVELEQQEYNALKEKVRQKCIDLSNEIRARIKLLEFEKQQEKERELLKNKETNDFDLRRVKLEPVDESVAGAPSGIEAELTANPLVAEEPVVAGSSAETMNEETGPSSNPSATQFDAVVVKKEAMETSKGCFLTVPPPIRLPVPGADTAAENVNSEKSQGVNSAENEVTSAEKVQESAS